MHCYLIGNRRIYCGETILALVSHKKKSNHKQKKPECNFPINKKKLSKISLNLATRSQYFIFFLPNKNNKKKVIWKTYLYLFICNEEESESRYEPNNDSFATDVECFVAVVQNKFFVEAVLIDDQQLTPLLIAIPFNILLAVF